MELAGLALSVLTGGTSAVVSTLMAGSRAAKVVALVARIEQEGTVLASAIRGVMEVIRAVERALKTLKEIRGVAAAGKMAKEGMKFSAFDTLLRDPEAFKDPAQLAGILTEGALLGVGFGALGKALGKGLKALKPADLAKLSKGLKLNCATFERLSLNPGFNKLPASIRNEIKKFVRDPIDVATGDMVLTRTDVSLPGVLPLVLERTHLSSYRWGGWFGPSWASTLDQRVQADDEGLVYAAADGARICFPFPEPEAGEAVRPETAGSCLILAWDDDLDGAVRVSDLDTGLTQVFHSPVVAATGTAMDLPLQYIQDRNGNRITITYAEGDIPTEIIHSGGYRIALDHHPELSRITGLRLLDDAFPDGPGTALLTFGYDTLGRLTEEINSSGLPLRHTYDTVGRITSWTDRNDCTYWYTYDDHGRVVATGGTGDALASSLTYDDAALTTRVTDALGHTTVYEHNAALRLTRETDPLGNTLVREWDDSLRLTAFVDPLGRTTRYSYDENGRVTSVTRPDGSDITSAYNELGLPVAVTEPDGSRWLRTYDALGNLERVTDPVGRTTVFAYDRTGALTRATDVHGHTTVVHNNNAGLPLRVIGATGAVNRCERDSFGRPVLLTDALGKPTRWDWTVEGKPLRRTAADGSQETWRYDGEGNCTEHRAADGALSQFEYTYFDLLSARTAPDGSRYEYTHNAELRLGQVRSPEGLTWDYEYDAAGRLVAEKDFDGRVQRYVHDPAGQLVQRTTPLGEVIRYRCDVLGRVTEKDVAGLVTGFEYDRAGRMVRATGPDSVLERSWGPGDVLLSETTVTEGAGVRSMAWSHDGLGRRTSRKTPSGVISTWDFDPVGNPIKLTTADRTVGFEHDAAGHEVARTFGERLTFTRSFDELGRLRHHSVIAPENNLVQDRTYIYRADGHLTRISHGYGGATDFEMDVAGRVTGVQSGEWRESYAYDSTGNQVEAYWPRSHPTADTQGIREYTGTNIVRAGDIRYEHDDAGRVILRQKKRLSRKPETWRYTWDADDRLIPVVTPEGTEWRYAYDPLGRRIAKSRIGGDGATVVERVDYTWDGAVLCEQVSHGGLLTAPVAITWEHYGQRPLTQTERVAPNGTNRVQGDERFFAIVTDLVGTPTELLDEDGTTAWRMRSTLWGATAWATTSDTYTPLRFPGQYFDPETGLHYNYFRYYDPGTARYCSPDPLGLRAGENPLTYPHNPCTWSDPLGLAPECGTGDPEPSSWFPDENYSPEAIAARVRGNPDRKAWFDTPRDVHDLVNELVRNPAYPQRLTGPARARVPDAYRGGNSRAGKRWAGSPIYDNGDPLSQLRVVVDGKGNIAYFGRGKDGSHNYDQLIPYPWAKRP
ncbi:DUF6531 domain-containing protein [Streptomyces sp. NPDC003757]